MERLIVLDTETTGLDVDDGHKIIEIGCIEIIDRNITENSFHYYIILQVVKFVKLYTFETTLSFLLFYYSGFVFRSTHLFSDRICFKNPVKILSIFVCGNSTLSVPFAWHNLISQVLDLIQFPLYNTHVGCYRGEQLPLVQLL